MAKFVTSADNGSTVELRLQRSRTKGDAVCVAARNGSGKWEPILRFHGAQVELLPIKDEGLKRAVDTDHHDRIRAALIFPRS